MNSGRKFIEILDKADAHPYGLRPFKRKNYINKFNMLTDKIVKKKEQIRFLKVVQKVEKLKAGQLNKLNIEVSKNYLNTKKLKGIF